jgi:nicotinate-nucleotide--dimethylbenzimidazole phosphoribosyltransferase
MNCQLISEIKNKIDNKTKPTGSLGVLEKISEKISIIQKTTVPRLINPHILVFAGDHGIAESGVSKYPQNVTHQMVQNFINGGAAINVFCRQNNITIKVVDAGTKGTYDDVEILIDAKIAECTKNFLEEPAMTAEQCIEAINIGRKTVKDIAKTGCNTIGFGEMGIANTSSASLLMHKFTNNPIEDCIGRGTGLDDEEYRKKIYLLKEAAEKYNVTEPIDILSVYGGFEIAEMCGAYIQAYDENMIIIIDGFIATSALAAAVNINKDILNNCIFSHQSGEYGHRKLLKYLNAAPILNLNLRLGEGTGIALVYPLIESSVNFLNEMASFDSAGVTKS